jgi:catechol 2,3-dioxygenase-like lactoylglutathione lyase family enzyme
MDFVTSHIGICCVNLDRSVHFNVDGLGFEVQNSYELHGLQMDQLLELGEAHMLGSFVKRGNLVLELLAFAPPNTAGAGEARPMNLAGETHLAFEVDNVDEVAKRIIDYGGALREHTLIKVLPEISGDHIALRRNCVRDVHGPRRNTDRTD